MLNAARIDELKTAFDRTDDGLELRIQEEDGKVRAEWWTEDTDRPRGQYHFDLDPDNHTVTFLILNFDPEYRSTGFSRKANAFFPGWLRKVKCPSVIIPAVINDGFYAHLLDSGFERQEDSLNVILDVSDKSSRLDQYSAWVDGKADEPKWHAELPDEYRLTDIPRQ